MNRSGIQFKRHEEEGIDVDDFAELLIPSGLVLVDTHFVSFHSPYDFGYLLKVLTNRNLPNEEEVRTKLIDKLMDSGLYHSCFFICCFIVAFLFCLQRRQK